MSGAGHRRTRAPARSGETVMNAQLPTIAPRHDLDYFDAQGCPDLQRFIPIFGGYSKIPAWAWARWDTDNAGYRTRMVVIATGSSTSKQVVPIRLYPASEECCRCYQHGVFGYRGETLARMGLTHLAALAEPGELIWFCDAHKPAKHFADARRDL
jgi:hypothetical protein